jgi:hypothetical protein
MKELNDHELLGLAYKEIRKMDVHIISTVIFAISSIIEFILTILQIISIPTYVIFFLVILVLYYYHIQKFKKCEKRIEEILDELTSRDI